MRTLLAAALSLVGLGFVASAPAEAAIKWTCVGPEYVCGSAPAVKTSPAPTQYKPAAKAKAKSVAVATPSAPAYKPAAKKKSSSYDSGDSGSYTLTGKASYYWQPQPVASGGWFNPNAMTAAHKTLPFGTKVRVTNQNNGQSVVVTINDRGPYIAGRIIDLSKAAAHAINMQNAGVVPVKVAVLGKG
jgi:rare lipoprotein A